MEASRPSRRISRPTAKLADGSNVEKAPFTFQRVAVEAENARVKAMQLSHSAASLPTLSESDPQFPPPSPSLVSTSLRTSPAPSDAAHIENDTPASTEIELLQVTVTSDNENDRAENVPKKKKRMHAARENSKCLTTIA